MSISKEANGTWTVQCYYNDWTGKKKHKKKRGFTTKKEAAEWERKFLLRSTPLEMTVADFVNVYFEDVEKSLKVRSLDTKRHVINKHILPYFGERPINSITAPEIIKWQNCIKEKGYAATYLRTIQNQLTAIFTHASRIYDMENNPCKKVEKWVKRIQRKLISGQKMNMTNLFSIQKSVHSIMCYLRPYSGQECELENFWH